MEKWQTWKKITFASGVDPDFTAEIASIPGCKRQPPAASEEAS